MKILERAKGFEPSTPTFGKVVVLFQRVAKAH
jgi:hypothetical protein